MPPYSEAESKEIKFQSGAKPFPLIHLLEDSLSECAYRASLSCYRAGESKIKLVDNLE